MPDPNPLRLARRLAGVEISAIRKVFDAAPPGAINFGLGQPDLATPEPIKEAGMRAIREDRTGYTATAGLSELRRDIAGRYPGFAAGPESVVVTCGSEEAVFLAVMALVDPGDEVLVPDPGYPAYPVLARLAGGVAVPYPLRSERGYALDPRDVEAALTPRTRLVVLNSPGNPTGALDRAADVDALHELLAGRGIAWLSDEVYANFVYEGRSETPWTRAAGRGDVPGGASSGVVVAGLSKDLCMTGWRVGWLVAHPDLIRVATALHQYTVTCASAVAQHAARVAFTDAGAAARRAILERFRARRDRALAILAGAPKLRVEAPRGAFYLFADVSARGDSASVCRELLERGVITIPGTAFGPRGEGRIRISFAASEADIERGMAVIRDLFA